MYHEDSGARPFGGGLGTYMRALRYVSVQKVKDTDHHFALIHYFVTQDTHRNHRYKVIMRSTTLILSMLAAFAAAQSSPAV
jgi:hypothetical protein